MSSEILPVVTFGNNFVKDSSEPTSTSVITSGTIYKKAADLNLYWKVASTEKKLAFNSEEVIIQYISVSQLGATIQFGPTTNTSISTGGSFTVNTLINSSDIDVSQKWFKIVTAGTYLIDFASGVKLNSPETFIKSGLITQTNNANPNTGSFLELSETKTTGVSAPLSFKYVRTFNADDTFYVYITSGSSGAASYQRSFLNIKKLA